jgi:hypothetical protein
MDYITVFDIAQTEFSLWWPSIILALLAVATTVPLFFARITPGRRKLAIGSAIAVYLSLGGGFLYSYVEYERLLAARSTGAFETVEGTVDNFQEEADEDTQSESFTVAGVRFDYDARSLTAAFHQTAFEGGPIRAGARVRIGHLDGSIVKLEIVKTDIPDDNARRTYAGTPPRAPLTEAEIRFFELPAAVAMFVFALRVALTFDLYARAHRILIRAFSGYDPTPSFFGSSVGRGLVLVWLGFSVGGLAWLLLNRPIELSWGQLPLFAFFTLFFVLFSEGGAHLVLWLGKRFDKPLGPS